MFGRLPTLAKAATENLFNWSVCKLRRLSVNYPTCVLWIWYFALSLAAMSWSRWRPSITQQWMACTSAWTIADNLSDNFNLIPADSRLVISLHKKREKSSVAHSELKIASSCFSSSLPAPCPRSSSAPFSCAMFIDIIALPFYSKSHLELFKLETFPRRACSRTLPIDASHYANWNIHIRIL